jgi:hypothetical protein
MLIAVDLYTRILYVLLPVSMAGCEVRPKYIYGNSNAFVFIW